MSEFELCPACKKGKFRQTENNINELVCDYCGEKCSDEGLSEYM